MLPTNLRDRLFSDVSMRTVRYVHAIGPGRAEGLARRVYEQIEDDFMFGGPLLVHSPTPALMAGMWVVGREVNLVTTALDRTSKEAIAAAVAMTNRCPYCVDLHTSLTHAGQQHQVAKAIRRGEPTGVDEPYWRSVIDWALSTRTPGAEVLRTPPFSAEQLPEAIGNVVFFNYVNRIVNVLFEGSALGDGTGVIKGLMLRTLGAELGDEVTRVLEAGRSLELLGPADLPAAFAWAEGQPVLADAVARWSAVVDRETDAAVPRSVKATLEEVLETWQGEDPPRSRGWLEPHVASAAADERPALRLALRTAFDSHRVTDDEVEPILADADESTLIQILAWGAFAAARHIGQWLRP